MESKKSLSRQIAIITRVQEETGLTRDQLAERVLVRPATMRKAEQGSYAFSERVLADIQKIPALLKAEGGPKPEAVESPAARRPAKPRGIAAICQRLSFVLGHTTPGESAILSDMVDAAFRQVSGRLLKAMENAPPTEPKSTPKVAPDNIIHIPVGFRLRAVLGDIAAGVPQEAIAQADQWVPVPPRWAKDTTFVLRVKGDSMVDKGIYEDDLVYINATREPRNNDIVAALCDHETTLKTFVTKGGETFLCSENKTFPPTIKPVEELTIQGVMIAKHRKP